MRLLAKLAIRIALNGAALWVAQRYFPGFMLSGGTALAAGALVLALLNIFVAPILRFITTPLRWLTLGLFNIVINIAVLALADYLLPQLTIHGYATLFWTSLIIALANAFF
ncbi:MAG: phage holin family protein [Patescibacteria group bacterium]